METLPVQIDCGKKTCDNCRFISGQLMEPFCRYFSDIYLKTDRSKNARLEIASGTRRLYSEDPTGPEYCNYHRLPECMAACATPHDRLDAIRKRIQALPDVTDEEAKVAAREDIEDIEKAIKDLERCLNLLEEEAINNEV